jgi:hypothetical protein
MYLAQATAHEGPIKYGGTVIENNDVRTDDTQPQWAAAPPPAYGTSPVPAGAQPPVGAPYGVVSRGPVGEVRSTGMCILLTIVTIGFYSLYWYYKTHDEMKRHTGSGLGGGLALLIAFLIGIVMPFVTAAEVGGLYERRGMKAPVGVATGLWALLLGWFFGVGLIIWFVKVNGALNEYWRSEEYAASTRAPR